MTPLSWLALPFLAASSLAQTPTIAPGGVVSAASFSADPQLGEVLVLGRLSTLFGANLARISMSASSVPLPLDLAGTKVTVAGMPAPLLFVSPGQVNFQVPLEVAGAAGQLVVTTAQGSGQRTVRIANLAPGVFTLDSSGCGPGAVLNVAPDGSVAVNDIVHSAEPGQFVSLYATGLGPVNFPPPDGYPAGSEPPSRTQGNPTLELGIEPHIWRAPPQYSGLAPGLVGTDQINFRVPSDAPEGCAVPLQVRSTVLSQAVTLAIRRGGGRCQDARLMRVASLPWSNRTVHGPVPGAVSSTARFVAQFTEGSSNWIGPPLPPRLGVWTTAGGAPPGPRCGAYTAGNTEAGTIELRTPLGTGSTVDPVASRTGGYTYETSFPSTAMGPGRLAAAGSGGPQIGPFQSSVTMPEPIRVLTDLRPGTVIDSTKPLRIEWSGGGAGALVTVQLLSLIPQVRGDRLPVGLEQSVAAAAGSITLSTVELMGNPALPLIPSDQFVVHLRHFAESPAAVTAAGLDYGDYQWEWELRFEGLRLQAGQ